jgi:hypothetical protein
MKVSIVLFLILKSFDLFLFLTFVCRYCNLENIRINHLHWSSIILSIVLLILIVNTHLNKSPNICENFCVRIIVNQRNLRYCSIQKVTIVIKWKENSNEMLLFVISIIFFFFISEAFRDQFLLWVKYLEKKTKWESDRNFNT